MPRKTLFTQCVMFMQNLQMCQKKKTKEQKKCCTRPT